MKTRMSFSVQKTLGVSIEILAGIVTLCVSMAHG